MKEMNFIFLSVILLFVCAAVSAVDEIEGACVQNAYTCDGPGKEVTYGPCNSTVCSFCPKTSLAYKTICEGEETTVEFEVKESWVDKMINYIKNAFLSLFGQGVDTRNCIASALGNPPSCSDNNNVCEPTTVNNRLLGDCAGVDTNNECIPCQGK